MARLKEPSLREGWQMLTDWVREYNQSHPNIQVQLPRKPRLKAEFWDIVREVKKTRDYTPIIKNGVLLTKNLPDLGRYTSIQVVAAPKAVPGFKKNTIKTSIVLSSSKLQDYRRELEKTNRQREKYNFPALPEMLNYSGSYSNLIKTVRKKGTKKYIEHKLRVFKQNMIKSLEFSKNLNMKNLSQEDLGLINKILSKIKRTSAQYLWNIFNNEDIVIGGGELFGSDETTTSSYVLNKLVRLLNIKVPKDKQGNNQTVDFSVTNDPSDFLDNIGIQRIFGTEE